VNPQPKRTPYRNKKILDAAQGEPCLVNLPCCTGGGADTVAAHSNSKADGKGASQKADDCAVAFACLNCHDVIDGRKKPPVRFSGDEGVNMPTHEIAWFRDRGIKRTIRRLLDKGIIK